MKRFMFKIAFALVIAVLLHVGVAHLPANKFDPYYLVMTKPQAPSLVLGTSRSAQGIDPAAFNALFVSQWQGPLFNFSLTNSTSPFGPVYTRAILQKLNPATTNGLLLSP